jgi:large subunit ribosomal protein L9
MKMNETHKKTKLETFNKEMYDKINGMDVFFELNKDSAGEIYGSINNREIIQKLREFNCEIDKNQLVDFKPLITIGNHLIRIKLSKDLIAEIKVLIK